MSSQKWLLPVSYPQGELHLPTASLRGSPRSAGGSHPGSFQITASALGLRVCEILCAPFKNRVYFLQPSGSPESKPHWPSESNVLRAYLPSTWPPGWGAQCGAQIPWDLGRSCAIVTILQFVDYSPVGVSLYDLLSLPLLPILSYFLLYILSCRRSFLLVFKSSSSIVALQIVVILEYPWEEVSSGSS